LARRLHDNPFLMMSRLAAAALLLLAATACTRSHTASPTPAQHAEMRTIDNADARPALLDPPPMLTDEGPPIKPRTQPGAFADAPEPMTEQDEQVRAQLPFAPAIAMDPVNGSKVSIRATTPMVEYKNHLYYFGSEENKREFQNNPELYLKGTFARL
jgi:YHS domain-containing protein